MVLYHGCLIGKFGSNPPNGIKGPHSAYALLSSYMYIKHYQASISGAFKISLCDYGPQQVAALGGSPWRDAMDWDCQHQNLRFEDWMNIAHVVRWFTVKKTGDFQWLCYISYIIKGYQRVI